MRPRPLLAALFTWLSSCTGEISSPRGMVAEPEGTPGPEAVYDPRFQCVPAALAPASIKRLARSEWLASIDEVLAPLPAGEREALWAAIQPTVDLLPSDSHPFAERADDRLSQQHVDATTDIAFAVAAEVTSHAGRTAALLAVCGPASTVSSLSNAACLGAFIERYGHKAFRRPLTAAERDDFAAFYAAQPADALTLLIARLLAHPRSYYLLDDEGTVTHADASTGEATYALTVYEWLSRVTLMFWGAPPDDALYALAAGLDPAREEDLARAVDYVLASPRARSGIAAFYRRWLHLDDLPQLPGLDTVAFRAFAAGEPVGEAGHHHRDEMIDEVLELATHYTLDRPGRYDDLLTSRLSFAGPGVARLYGVAPWVPGGAPVMLPESERAGLLTRAALLVSGSETVRPIIRGKLVRERILCDELPPPPPNVQITPLQPDPQRTQRQIVEDATSGATCRGCHAAMNPLGFAAGGYDALGRARRDELKLSPEGLELARLPVDTTATVSLFAGHQVAVADSIELGLRIADSGKGQQCLTRHAFRFTFWRKEAPADGCDLEALRLALTGPEGNLKGMFHRLALLPAVRHRAVR